MTCALRSCVPFFGVMAFLVGIQVPSFRRWDWGRHQEGLKMSQDLWRSYFQQRLKNPIDYPIGTPVGSYKVT